MTRCGNLISIRVVQFAKSPSESYGSTATNLLYEEVIRGSIRGGHFRSPNTVFTLNWFSQKHCLLEKPFKLFFLRAAACKNQESVDKSDFIWISLSFVQKNLLVNYFRKSQ